METSDKEVETGEEDPSKVDVCFPVPEILSAEDQMMDSFAAAKRKAGKSKANVPKPTTTKFFCRKLNLEDGPFWMGQEPSPVCVIFASRSNEERSHSALNRLVNSVTKGSGLLTSMQGGEGFVFLLCLPWVKPAQVAWVIYELQKQFMPYTPPSGSFPKTLSDAAIQDLPSLRLRDAKLEHGKIVDCGGRIKFQRAFVFHKEKDITTVKFTSFAVMFEEIGFCFSKTMSLDLNALAGANYTSMKLEPRDRGLKLALAVQKVRHLPVGDDFVFVSSAGWKTTNLVVVAKKNSRGAKLLEERIQHGFTSFSVSKIEVLRKSPPKETQPDSNDC
jgi:hypothetical protein